MLQVEGIGHAILVENYAGSLGVHVGMSESSVRPGASSFQAAPRARAMHPNIWERTEYLCRLPSRLGNLHSFSSLAEMMQSAAETLPPQIGGERA